MELQSQPKKTMKIQSITSANFGGSNLAIQRKCQQCEEDEDEEGLATIQPKLNIGSPGDKFEREADAVAEKVSNSSFFVAQIDHCTNCSPEIQRRGDQGEIQRKPEATNKSNNTINVSQVISSSHIGQPLLAPLRQKIEPVLGADLSQVKVHSNTQSRDAAASINAKAFTHKNNIYLGANQSAGDLSLMAHEATHTVQQSSGSPRVFRSPLDPDNTYAWEFMEPRHRREGWMQDTFLETLSAATEASVNLQNDVTEDGDPETDAEKSIFAGRMRHLVRLNALGLMASHRAAIESRQEETIRSFEDRTEPEGEFDREVAGRNSILRRIRETGAKVHQLQQLREELDGYRRDLSVVNSISLINSRSFTAWTEAGFVNEIFNTIADSASNHNSVAIRNYLRRTARSVFGESRSTDSRRYFAHIISGYLESWRQGQINGIDLSLSKLYEAYPFFSELNAEDFTEGEYSNDEALGTAVRGAYREILSDIDKATADIGRNDIHPFDLPEAMNYTKNSLPENMHGNFDEVISDHEMSEFWWSLGLTFAQIALVFIPVVGPALAAGVGLLDLAIQTEEIMDQVTMSDAATNPGGELLGIGGPGTLDWALLAVTAILTAADLGMVAREFRVARGAMALDALRLGEGQIDELTSLIDDLAIAPAEVGRLGAINDSTLELFQSNPQLLRALSDNPVVAKLLKHCASPCWPENLEPWAVEYLGDFMSDMSARGLSLEDVGLTGERLNVRLAAAADENGVTRIFSELEENLAGVENRAHEQLRGSQTDLAHGGESVRSTGGSPNDTIINERLAGGVHNSGVPFDAEGYPVFQSEHNFTIPEEMRGPATPDDNQFVVATAHLRRQLQLNPALRSHFTPAQLVDIEAVSPRIRGLTWHHHQDRETLQLIDSVTHRRAGHSGGRARSGGRNAPL